MRRAAVQGCSDDEAHVKVQSRKQVKMTACLHGKAMHATDPLDYERIKWDAVGLSI